jgi:hypothetical protein
MNIDWRLYESLTRESWRIGDEPEIKNHILVTFDNKRVMIPVPFGAEVSVRTTKVVEVKHASNLTPCSYHKGFKEDCGCP